MTGATDARRFAPATERNRGPILEVLRSALPESGSVLEIASGTGEHVVWFARSLPGLAFQPSDPDPGNRASIVAWVRHCGVTNVEAPLDIDAAGERWPVAGGFDAILCINMIHISPWAATLGLMRNSAAALSPGGLLCLYGPFRRDGAHTAPSNEAFDESLRERDPAWGVRDLATVTEAAASSGLMPDGVVTMPANNLSVMFRRA
ncbi:MAG: DUF938 domain-containing protein [Betaproteobacteria bacterium]